jgi:hypothetical protein
VRGKPAFPNAALRARPGLVWCLYDAVNDGDGPDNQLSGDAANAHDATDVILARAERAHGVATRMS